MKSPVTIDSLLNRIKKEVQQKEKQSLVKKAEARQERLRREAPKTIYEQEQYWFGVAIHREFEIQICDCCKQEQTVFNCDKVELRHRLDRSAIRWLRERGEGMDDLPIRIHIIERVIPECFCCMTLGLTLKHLWKGKANENPQAPEGNQSSQQAGGSPQGPQVDAGIPAPQEEVGR